MRRERIRKNRRTLYLTLTGIGAAVIFVAVFINLVFPCFSISFITLLYIASTRSGTPTNTETSYSFKFCATYLKPSGKDVLTPQDSITINAVDPNI